METFKNITEMLSMAQDQVGQENLALLSYCQTLLNGLGRDLFASYVWYGIILVPNLNKSSPYLIGAVQSKSYLKANTVNFHC